MATFDDTGMDLFDLATAAADGVIIESSWYDGDDPRTLGDCVAGGIAPRHADNADADAGIDLD